MWHSGSANDQRIIIWSSHPTVAHTVNTPLRHELMDHCDPFLVDTALAYQGPKHGLRGGQVSCGPRDHDMRALLHDMHELNVKFMHVEDRGNIGQRHPMRDGQGRDAVDIDQIWGPAAEPTEPSSPLKTAIRPLPDPAQRPFGDDKQRSDRTAVILERAANRCND